MENFLRIAVQKLEHENAKSHELISQLESVRREVVRLKTEACVVIFFSKINLELWHVQRKFSWKNPIEIYVKLKLS